MIVHCVCVDRQFTDIVKFTCVRISSTELRLYRSDISSPSLLYSHADILLSCTLSMQLHIVVENVVAVCMYNYHICVCV